MERELRYDHSSVPGVVVNHSPADTKQYVGSPSIAVLPDGAYVVSHDLFGQGTENNRTVVFRSDDKGVSWKKVSDLIGQWWSTLFTHLGALYILGTDREYGHMVIRRSADGGRSWTSPEDEHKGHLSPEGGYHCAPVPVITHRGRVWRAFELAHGKRPEWAAQVASVSDDADLLRSESWRFSAPYEHLWSGSQWIEGNVVVTPENRLVNLLRTNGQGDDRAALLHISDDGKTLSHDREKDIIDFPGGGSKFTVRFDPKARRYWSLANKQTDPPAKRNTLVLNSSHDLKGWKVNSVILHHPDPQEHAFQYVDWLFEGEDIIFVSRTAYDDGGTGAHTFHDANYITFHVISEFRDRTMEDSALC